MFFFFFFFSFFLFAALVVPHLSPWVLYIKYICIYVYIYIYLFYAISLWTVDILRLLSAFDVTRFKAFARCRVKSTAQIRWEVQAELIDDRNRPMAYQSRPTSHPRYDRGPRWSRWIPPLNPPCGDEEEFGERCHFVRLAICVIVPVLAENNDPGAYYARYCDYNAETSVHRNNPLPPSLPQARNRGMPRFWLSSISSAALMRLRVYATWPAQLSPTLMEYPVCILMNAPWILYKCKVTITNRRIS